MLFLCRLRDGSVQFSSRHGPEYGELPPMRIARTLCSLTLAAGFALYGCKTPGSTPRALTPEQEEPSAEVIE